MRAGKLCQVTLVDRDAEVLEAAEPGPLFSNAFDFTNIEAAHIVPGLPGVLSRPAQQIIQFGLVGNLQLGWRREGAAHVCGYARTTLLGIL